MSIDYLGIGEKRKVQNTLGYVGPCWKFDGRNLGYKCFVINKSILHWISSRLNIVFYYLIEIWYINRGLPTKETYLLIRSWSPADADNILQSKTFYLIFLEINKSGRTGKRWTRSAIDLLRNQKIILSFM